MPAANRRPKTTTRKTGSDALRNSLPGIALVVASVLPSALSPSPASKPGKAPTPKEFSIPMANLQDWANSVVVTMEGVQIKGNSKVHALASDCELHFGAASDGFEGDPAGLVLEPMNVCIAPFPGKTEQSNADWLAFADSIKNTTVTIAGVPRIWPEHLSGGNETSNPNHAVEIHPLTQVVTTSEKLDFAPNVFAGEFTGGLGKPTAEKIVQNISVTVAKVDESAEISFRAGTIGNFTVLDLVIDKASIINDATGSFRMKGAVVLENSTNLPVQIVTVLGSRIKDEIAKIKKSKRKQVSIQGLVLFSLSPQALLEAANKSDGSPVDVRQPIQLILYGTPDSE